MSVTIQDNFNLAAAKAVDNRYEKVSSGGVSIPYANLTEAYTAIPSVYRHLGLTVCLADGTSIKEYWFKDNLTTLVPKSGAVGGAKNGLTLDTGDGNIKLGGALTENTVITLGPAFDTNSLNLFISPTSTVTETQKGVFSCFSPTKFYNNVSIGGLAVSDKYSSPNYINKQPLYVYRADGILDAAVCTSTYSLYELYGSSIGNFAGSTTTVSAALDQFEWAASIDINLSNVGALNKSGATFAGNKSYFVYNSLYNTTNGNISANSAQGVFRARRQIYTGVSSSGSTLTVPAGTLLADQVSSGDSIIADGVSGWPVSVIANVVTATTITMQYWNGSSWVAYTPSSSLSSAVIIIGRKGTVSLTPNSIDNFINYRAMTPAPDVQVGYRGTLGKVVGLQIDDLRAGVGSSQNPLTERSKGNLTSSYGILQLGQDDINQFNSKKNTFPNMVNAADDSAAATAGVPQWGLYRTGNVVKIRITP